MIDCDITWKFKCPQDSANLSPSGDAWVRHCSTCSRNVVLCGNLDQVEAARRMGACAAITQSHEDERSEFLLGEIAEDP